MPTVIAITTAVGISAPITDTTTNSPMLIAFRTPNASAIPFATTASSSESDSDRPTAAHRF